MRNPDRFFSVKNLSGYHMQNLMNIKAFLNRNTKNTILFFIIFYSVGIAGMLFPFTFPLFVKLIPLALLLSFTALAFFHDGKLTSAHAFVFSAIFVTGFLIEAIGVNTGVIFGQYHYGSSLGLKLFNTPVIIGLNWLLLVYLTASMLEKTAMHAALKVGTGALLMLGYDLIIEQVAPVLDMWYWHHDGVPAQNYISWFVIAVIFHALIRGFRLKTSNKLAPVLFACQVIFFFVLFIFLN
jgi:bisanhydrobacterioruberin hydratase